MKKIFFLLCCIVIAGGAMAQNNKKINQPDSTKKILIVEASCGECQFHMAAMVVRWRFVSRARIILLTEPRSMIMEMRMAKMAFAKL